MAQKNKRIRNKIHGGIKNNMIKALVLEDNRERIIQFRDRFAEAPIKIVADYTDRADECIEKLKNIEYSLIFLDHDLGDEIFVSLDREDCGSAVARWFRDNPENINKDSLVIIHSFNTGGREYMAKLIPNSIEIPSVWTKEVFSKINFNINDS